MADPVIIGWEVDPDVVGSHNLRPVFCAHGVDRRVELTNAAAPS